jgi:hypothetical protein
MKIAKATQKYEAWLSRRLHIIEADLNLKHEQMRSGPFPFMRATFYRWAQTWEDICGSAARGPKVLSVGDLHVENFGTWRDIEGRLVWGINDFDEAWHLPYSSDLIRLATSALLAQLNCDPKEGVATILKGYANSLAAGGRAFVLAEYHPPLRSMAMHRLHEPEKYWEKLLSLPEIKEEEPAGARRAIDRMMPERGLRWKTVHRIAGLGSLGRERYVAIAEWRGGSIAREAKALAPSACVWAQQGSGTAPLLYQEVLNHAVRCRDPFVRLLKRWIVRRLAPDCSRIELVSLPRERDELRLLYDMGWETANIHLGSIKPRTLLADLKKRPAGWLFEAARKMEKAVFADFEAFSTR